MKKSRPLAVIGFKLAAGMACFLAQSLPATVRYVDLNSTHATAPFTNWDTAAVTIQDAIDEADPGDEILVTNGVYAAGGRVVSPYLLTNRVAVTKAVTIQSVNGPEVTVIEGYQVPGTTYGDSAVRCIYLTNGATLVGVTLTKGATRSSGDWTYEQSGGGAWCESTSADLSNCVLVANSASTRCGGIWRGTLNHCKLFPFRIQRQDGVLALRRGGEINAFLPDNRS